MMSFQSRSNGKERRDKRDRKDRRDRTSGNGHGERKRAKKVCWFTLNAIKPDYKDIKIIARYVTERGRIVPRRLSGVSASNQRLLAKAVKRARHLGLLPYISENLK